MCQYYRWTHDNYPLVSYLLDLGGPFHGVPTSITQKINMQYIIKKDEDGTAPNSEPEVNIGSLL